MFLYYPTKTESDLFPTVTAELGCGWIFLMAIRALFFLFERLSAGITEFCIFRILFPAMRTGFSFFLFPAFLKAGSNILIILFCTIGGFLSPIVQIVFLSRSDNRSIEPG